MNGPKEFDLYFEERDGGFSAKLTPEAWEALLQTPSCLPWCGDGKRGMLYCDLTLEDAVRQLWTVVKENPLMDRLVHRLAYLNEIDGDGRLYLPIPAARFAQIREWAVLIRQAPDRLLLMSAEQAADKPKEGKLLRVEF